MSFCGPIDLVFKIAVGYSHDLYRPQPVFLKEKILHLLKCLLAKIGLVLMSDMATNTRCPLVDTKYFNCKSKQGY